MAYAIDDLAFSAQWSLWGLASKVSDQPVVLATGSYDRVCSKKEFYSQDPGKWSVLQILPKGLDPFLERK